MLKIIRMEYDLYEENEDIPMFNADFFYVKETDTCNMFFVFLVFTKENKNYNKIEELLKKNDQVESFWIDTVDLYFKL